MPRAIAVNPFQASADGADSSGIIVNIEFRIAGVTPDLGVLYAAIRVSDTDTQATVTTKVQAAIVSKAADYGITLASADVIPFVLGVPNQLMSPTSSATLTATDDGVNQQFVGSLGALKFQAAVGPTMEITNVGFSCIGMDFGGGSFIRIGMVGVYGSNDMMFQGAAAGATDWAILEQAGGKGVALSTTGGGSDLISVRPNRSEVAYFDANGLNMAAGAKIGNVAAQSGGKSVTNNVTAGGTADQGDDFTSLTLYASDAAAIRNNIYQLWQKLDRMADGLRTIGLLANS